MRSRLSGPAAAMVTLAALGQSTAGLAGVTVTGGGDKVVTEGQGGHIEFRVKNDGPNTIEVRRLGFPNLNFFRVVNPNGDETDRPKLTEVIGLGSGVKIGPNRSKTLSIAFSSPFPTPDKVPENVDFGEWDLQIDKNVIQFMDLVTKANIDVNGTDFPATSITVRDVGYSPEPSSLVLVGFGALALAGYGWRRVGRH